MLVLPDSPRWLASAGRFGEVFERWKTRADRRLCGFNEARQAGQGRRPIKLGTFRDLTFRGSAGISS